ncbi:hypothetical protein TNCV_3486141 [Trichonephila clavipes]|nr:hypothetical protein TNCV_3486141 [Trichonephila clavipes]
MRIDDASSLFDVQLDTLRENCEIIRNQASTDGGVLLKVLRVNVVQVRRKDRSLRDPREARSRVRFFNNASDLKRGSAVFMILDFAPDLPNESINFTFVRRVSGVIPELTESILSSDKLSDVFRKAEVWSVY